MFKRFLTLLILGAVIAVAVAASVTLGPLSRARADSDRVQAMALLPSQVREAEAQARGAEARADVQKSQAQADIERATFWRIFWQDALRYSVFAAAVGVYGVVLLLLVLATAPVTYAWIFTLSHAALIWPDVRGNLPIAPGNPILFDDDKALVLTTNAQIAATITNAVRSQADAATAQTLTASINHALVNMADMFQARGARQAAQTAPTRRWIAPRAADPGPETSQDWAADMIEFVKRGSEVGFQRRVWVGRHLASGRECTPTIWAVMRGDLISGRLAQQDGRGGLHLAVTVAEALERLDLGIRK